MKFLSPRVHGYLDYLVVALFLVAPTIFGFTGVAAALCYIIAIFQGLMSLLTAYPLGVAKVIPFTVHGAIEAVAAVFLFVSPWLFNFSYITVERNYYIATGVALAVVWLFTDYRAAQTTITGRTGYTAARRTG